MNWFKERVEDFGSGISSALGFVEDVVNVVTGAVGEVIAWAIGYEETEIERNALINKQSNNAPIPIIYGERRIGGTRVFVAVGGSNNEYLYIAQVLCEGEINGVKDTLINDIPIDDPRFAGIIVNVHAGTDDQAADSMLVNANVGWTANHRLRGIAYLAIRLNYNPDVFNSIPTITCVVEGKKIYNTITQTVEYSDNPALCLGDYLYNSRYGKGLPVSLIDIPSFTAAAVKCDELVAKYTGAPSNEPIFRCNAILDPSQTIFDNVQRLLSGMRGLLPFSNGQYKLIVEDDTDPVFSFDTSNIIDRIRISSNTKNQKYNRVSVDFANPDANWQTDTAIWPPSGSTEETTFLSEDNGIELTTSVNLSTITDYYAARDIARIICLESRRAKLAVSFRSTTDAMQCEVGDVVTVSHPTPAWTDKEFRVTSMVFNADGTISLALKEHDASIYPWITDAEADAVAQSTLPDPFTVAAPTNLQAQAGVFIQPDGTSIPVFDVSWTASADAFVSEYEIQYQTGADDYASVVTRETNFQIQNVVPASTYIIRVRAVNSMGARSDFATITNQTAVKDDQAPATPTGLTASGGIQSVQLDWTGNSESDLRGYFVYENTSNNPSTAATLGFVSADVFTITNLPDSVTRYYWVSAVDFSGNESPKSSVASATTLPQPTDGTSVLVVYADDANGNNQSLTVGSRQFVQYVEYTGTAPSLPVGGTFVQFIGDDGQDGAIGQSIWPIYATSAAGANQSFISSGRGYVTFYESTTQPSLPVSGQTFVKFVGEDGEDGTAGSTGPRNATGYVFYQIQTSGSPSTPSASSYNFSTGNFSGLTSNWDERVSTQTPIEGRNYWASRYSVSESTFGGSQSISFTSPFVWQNFDGLVTFTNIEDGIDENVTTIDGGNVDLVNLNASNITSGIISTNVLYTGILDLDDRDVGAGTILFDPQWGFSTAAFHLTSKENPVGLFADWSSGSTDTNGTAVYGRAISQYNTGAAVVGVNYGNGGSLSSNTCHGGFFQTTKTGDHTNGVTGTTNSTGASSAGGNFQSPFGGVGLRCASGKLVVGRATSNEGAEIQMAATSGPSWNIDVDGANFWRVFYDVSPFRQMYLRPDNGNLVLTHGTFIPFTGAHHALVDQNQSVEIGDIAIDTDRIFKSGISQTTTFVNTSQQANDKRAIGVFSSDPSELTRPKDSETVETTNLNGDVVTYESKPVRDNALSALPDETVNDLCDEGAKLLTVNSVGEGQINVCGQAGNIDAGDLIVTSDIAGKGMKQSDEIVRSITVAKARESVTFNDPSEIKQIACIYLCG